MVAAEMMDFLIVLLLLLAQTLLPGTSVYRELVAGSWSVVVP
jgi:hypothetical protein